MYWILLIPFSILSFINSLVINELQNWSLTPSSAVIDNPARDFLDVDVKSDLLDTSVSIKVSSEPLPNSENVYSFFDTKGNQFQCQLSYPATEVPLKRSVNFETIKQILLKRTKSCYYFKSPNWIYEYCHMKYTRQVNRKKINGDHDEIPLGRYYPPQSSLKMDVDLSFATAEFDNGKFCALKGAPRVSHVKYVCANSKTTMYVVEVVEAPICEYNFIIHVPELCEFFGKHATSIKRKATVSCHSAALSAPAEKQSSKKSSNNIEGLDKILGVIESQYKDSALLLQYKDLLRKASERLKAEYFAKKLSEEEDQSLSEMIKLFFPKSSEAKVDEPDEEQKAK